MSRRKDRQRFEAMRRLNPDYRGFRGYGNEADRPGKTPLVAVTCTLCGRKRNVPAGVAAEQGDAFICSTCREEGAAEAPQPEP